MDREQVLDISSNEFTLSILSASGLYPMYYILDSVIMDFVFLQNVYL